MAEALRTPPDDLSDPLRRRVADWLADTAADALTPHLAHELASGNENGLILGPYLLTDLLGRGGMGAVYRGWHSLLRRSDAVKVMSPDAVPAAGVARFLREVAVTARLRHPNVVAVHAADQHADRFYLAMELVRGEDLSRWLKRLGPLPVAEVVDAIRHAARGLGAAHALGMVHRDIKPGNLLREDTGRVLVADFGLARWGGCARDPSFQTRSDMILGTPAYMAPEQIEDGTRTDIRADLYGLGATAFHLLAGRPPFTATGFALLQAHLTQPAPDVRSLRPDVPAAVATVVARLLEKNPADRYQTPAELERALDGLSPKTTKPHRETPAFSARDHGTGDTDATVTRELVPDEQATVPVPRRGRPDRSPRRRRLVAGAVAVLVAVGVAAGWILTRPTPTTAPKSSKRAPDSPPLPPVPGAPGDGASGRWSPGRTEFACSFTRKVVAVGYRPDGRVVAASAAGEWAVWAASGGNPTASGQFPNTRPGNTPHYYLPGSGHFLSDEFDRWTHDGKADGKLPVEFPAEFPELADLKATYLGGGASSPDGRFFVAGATMSGGNQPPVAVLLWEPAKGAIRGWRMNTRRAVKAVAVTPDGRTVAAATQDRTVHVWPSGGKERSWTEREPAVALALTADGTTLYAVEAGHETPSLFRFDTAAGDGRKVGTATGQCNRLTLSPDGRWLMAAGYGMRVWRMQASPADPADADTLAPADGDMIEDAMFDPTSRRLLVGGARDGKPFIREYELRAE